MKGISEGKKIRLPFATRRFQQQQKQTKIFKRWRAILYCCLVGFPTVFFLLNRNRFIRRIEIFQTDSNGSRIFSAIWFEDVAYITRTLSGIVLTKRHALIDESRSTR